jgi:hypothetical protein
MDTRYFQYQAETHGKNLDGENRQRAAVALRTSYYHGLETLFMLIFAVWQSPHCIVGWLSKCEHWPELDVDLDLERIEHPEKFPLVALA